MELGEVKPQQSSSGGRSSNNPGTCHDGDVPQLDPSSRSKFNASGTHIWNMIQKHPELFADTTTSSYTSTTVPSHHRTNMQQEQQQYGGDLERNRGAASGHIRSLACRLILISKVQTFSNDIPQLIQVRVRSSEEEQQQPLALSSELQFGLKCSTRAGRALLLHSYSSSDKKNPHEIHATSWILDPYQSAFQALSFAIVCWEGLRQVNVDFDHGDHGRGRGRAAGVRFSGGYSSSIGEHARADAFDALLLLPDCASKLIPLIENNRKGGEKDDSDVVDKDKETNDEVGGSENQDEECCYSPNSERIIVQLQRLEQFVNDQCSAGQAVTERENSLEGSGRVVSITPCSFAIQHYLPSLARVGYKVRGILRPEERSTNCNNGFDCKWPSY